MARLRMNEDVSSRQVIAAADRAVNHSLFRALFSLEDVQRYMEFHVWCVWDFMCLVKAVQTALGTFSVPWLPPRDGALLATINKIIEGEETDIGPDGRTASHFDMYLAAMRQAGADVTPITAFIAALPQGFEWRTALERSGAPAAAVDFVSGTIKAGFGPLHRAVASLCLAREELLPMMFGNLLTNLPERPELDGFRWYIRRNIQLDADVHGPLSSELFEGVAGGDPRLRQEALETAAWSITQRTAYLEAILKSVRKAC